MKKIISFALVLFIIISCATTVVFAIPKTNQETVRYSVLILDSSGSMRGEPRSAQIVAAEKFCDALLSAGGKNYVSIIKINTSSSKVCDFTDDVDSLKEAINGIGANGGTNINGALGIANALLSSVNNDTNVIKNIILCSDGLPEDGSKSYNGPYYSSDSSYNYSYANAAYSTASAIKDNGTFIYTLGFFHSLYGTKLEFGRKFMNDLQNAGYYEVTDPNDLEFVFGEIADDVTNSVKELDFTYNAGRDYTAKCYYSNDYFAGDSYTYNQHLATMSISFAMSAFGSEEGGEKDYSDKSKNAKDLLQRIGVKPDCISTNSWFNKKPTTDSIAVIAGNMPIKVNGSDYTLIAVAVRGGGYEQEWASNFTIGTNGNHDGFDTAKSNVIDFLKNYVVEQGINGKVKLWITGFSRAAATANLVSGALHSSENLSNSISLSNEDIYTYCFETPAGVIVSNDPSNDMYNNIFNIINLSDPVPYVAPATLGFRRYGIDKYTPSAESNPQKYGELKAKMLKVFDSLDSTSEYIVDDFKMKKVVFDWGLKIEDDENNNLSQGSFLSGLVATISNKIIKNRSNYVVNYQDAIREVFSVLYGCTEEKKNILIESISTQAKDHWWDALWAYIQPFGSEDKVAKVVAEWVKKGMDDASISYTESVIDSTSKQICKLIRECLDLTVGDVTTAAMNLNGIGAAHYPDLCYSWMASMDSYYNENAQELFNNGGYRIIRINCAVDITVSDSNGLVVASITNDKPDTIANSNYLYGVDEDGQKYVILPVDDSYTISISGREDDTVDYGILEYSAFAGDFTRNVNYFNVNLSKGDYLVGTVSPYSESEIEMDSGTGSSAIYTLSTSDGTTLDPNSDISGDEVASKTYLVTVTSSDPEHGMVSGTGVHYYGEYAEITATPADGYKFVGWYENDSQVSKDATYRFRVENDRELLAKFESTTSKKDTSKISPKVENDRDFLAKNESTTLKKDTSKISPKTGYNNRYSDSVLGSIIAIVSLFGFIVIVIIAKHKRKIK